MSKHFSELMPGEQWRAVSDLNNTFISILELNNFSARLVFMPDYFFTVIVIKDFDEGQYAIMPGSILKELLVSEINISEELNRYCHSNRTPWILN